MRAISTPLFPLLVMLIFLQIGCERSFTSGVNQQNTDNNNIVDPKEPLPTIPVLSVTGGIKTFHFSWTSNDAISYQLRESLDDVIFVDVGQPTIEKKLAHEVFLINKINAKYKIRACNVVGCVESNIVGVDDVINSSIGYFKKFNTVSDDFFGVRIALSANGKTLAVGAYGEDSNTTGIDDFTTNSTAPNSGAVHIFSKISGSWVQESYIKASNANTSDHFGISVALSADGNTLAVGASGEASNATGINGNQADNSLHGSGAVYLFSRTGYVWTQQAYIKASNPGLYDNFGEFVSLAADGNTLAVGASSEGSNATGVNGNQANNSMLYSGAAYVFVRSGMTWTQQAYIKASNTEASDYFGRCVALSADGNTLATSAFRESSSATGINGDQTSNVAGLSGAVYVFVRSGTTWTQQAYVKASNTGPADYFGLSLSLSSDGNTMAVRASEEDSAAMGVNGNQLDNSATDSGAVYVFSRSGTIWTQQAYIKASNTDANDGFGSGVSLSGDGNMLAVGALREDSNGVGFAGNQADNNATNSGAVYVFVRSGTAWTQKAYIKAPNTDANDEFGTNAILSADGETLAVSSYKEDSDAVTIGGNQSSNAAVNSGAMYMY